MTSTFSVTPRGYKEEAHTQLLSLTPAATQTRPTQLWANLGTCYFLPKWQSKKHRQATWKRAGELQGDHRNTEESQGTVMGRAQRVHRGAGGTTAGIRETYRELEIQHQECWAVTGAPQYTGRRLGLPWWGGHKSLGEKNLYWLSCLQDNLSSINGGHMCFIYTVPGHWQGAKNLFALFGDRAYSPSTAKIADTKSECAY